MQSLPSRKRQRQEASKIDKAARHPLTNLHKASIPQASCRPADIGKTLKNASCPELKQAVLALGQKPTIITCNECDMQYSKISPEDYRLHLNYCKSAKIGLTWKISHHTPASKDALLPVVSARDGPKVAGSIARLEYKDANQHTRKKLSQIRAVVDEELQAVQATEAELSDSIYYLFLSELPVQSRGQSTSRQHQILGIAIIRRITQAYQVIPHAQPHSVEHHLRFGETDGALYCMPTPVPARIGVDRIWTSPGQRGNGIATALLDSIASNVTYGTSIRANDRSRLVAFSQPTAHGARLFEHWTNSGTFLIFVDE